MTPADSGTRYRPRAYSPAFQGVDPATSRSNTPSAATVGVAASRSCSAASRTGVASPPATTAAPPRSSPPSPSLPPSSSGCNQRVLTLSITGAPLNLCDLEQGVDQLARNASAVVDGSWSYRELMTAKPIGSDCQRLRLALSTAVFRNRRYRPRLYRQPGYLMHSEPVLLLA